MANSEGLTKLQGLPAAGRTPGTVGPLLNSFGFQQQRSKTFQLEWGGHQKIGPPLVPPEHKTKGVCWTRRGPEGLCTELFLEGAWGPPLP